MKTKVLTIEQAKYLIEKGVDMSDAKVWWMVNTCNARGRKEDLLPPYITVNKSRPIKVGMTSFERIPTYTLDDIIEKLPNGIPEPAYDGYAEDMLPCALIRHPYGVSLGTWMTPHTSALKKSHCSIRHLKC